MRRVEGSARQLQRLEDAVVRFDGAGFAGSQGPMAASGCEEIIQGGWSEWSKLEAALARGTAEAKVGARPASGGLAGWIDYEGHFRFAVVREFVPAGPAPSPAPPPQGGCFQPSLHRREWCRRVRRIKEYIAAGDIYQVNLTHAFTRPWEGDGGGFYARLLAVSPAPYACRMRLGDCEVLSVSPECFLRIEGRGISTRPIKGTRARCEEAAQDEAAMAELLGSEKERAELVMITDLERNDLGQVCRYGSVEVTELCQLESFAQVHHMVSTVRGVLREDTGIWQAVRACFPGGSITGAPKGRAREIITELEEGPRGLYTGALGYVRWDGLAVFSIAIRTVVLRGGLASYGTGSGIVADSDPEAEYEETLHKTRGLLLAEAAPASPA